MDKPSYYAVIPATVRYDENISSSEKLFYGEITALSNECGFCWATNKYFSTLYNVSTSTVSLWIKNLKDRQHIVVEYIKDGKVIKQRNIYPIQKIGIPYSENLKGGGQKIKRGWSENPKDNITSNNTTSNNILMSEATASDVSEKNVPHFDIAKAFYQLFQHNSNSLGVTWKNLETAKADKFIDQIRLTIEADNRTLDEMRDVFNFLKRDQFWMKNIQSSKTLREKFDKLITQAKTNGTGQSFIKNVSREFVDSIINDPNV